MIVSHPLGSNWGAPPPTKKKTTKSAVLFVRWALLNALKTAVRKNHLKMEPSLFLCLASIFELDGRMFHTNACFFLENRTVLDFFMFLTP